MCLRCVGGRYRQTPWLSRALVKLMSERPKFNRILRFLRFLRHGVTRKHLTLCAAETLYAQACVSPSKGRGTLPRGTLLRERADTTLAVAQSDRDQPGVVDTIEGGGYADRAELGCDAVERTEYKSRSSLPAPCPVTKRIVRLDPSRMLS
jgi:hypothetical protein